MLFYKLRSGALQFTIFISVIIALLLAGIILLVYTHRHFLEQSKDIVSNIQFADTGISYLLHDENFEADTLTFSKPYEDNGQFVKVHLSKWGIFEKAYVETKNRNKKFIKCSLLGSVIKDGSRPALYLQETFKPLAVVGNTNITGLSLLPQQGVKPGYIAGNSYYRPELISGVIDVSTTELPELSHNYINDLKYYLEEYKPENENDFINIRDVQKVNNSFKEQVKGYYSDASITLDNISVSGNIIIRSAEKIIVHSSVQLKDVILAAPLIEIQDGFRGSFQAIASTSVTVGKRCHLSYPTAIILVEKEEIANNRYDKYNNTIFFDEFSVIKGTVGFLTTKSEVGFKPNIFISLHSSIKGEIYCQGNLELRGNVTGTVYTKQFIVNEGGTVFLNHIHNATISNKNLPEDFGGMLIRNQSKSIVKWLY